MTEQKSTLDFGALHRAAEHNDAKVLANLYTEDAEALIVNCETTPSSSHILQGRGQITGYLKDVCRRDIKSSLENEVVGEERIAFNETCEYADGTRVLSATTLEVRDDKIARQVSVEAWDE